MNKMTRHFLAATMAGALPFLAGPASADQPSVISFGTHTAGTGGYQLFSLAAESIIEKTGIKVRLVPAGADVARAMIARQGEADVAALNSLTAWTLQEGLFDYATPDWGPQPVAYLWAPEHIGAVFAVHGDSDIKTVADLKGKKVASFPGSPGQHLMNEALLAFGGLGWNDVVAVPSTGAGAAYESVIKGRIDSTFFNIASGKTRELASMPGGLRYLEVPASDTEGWKRLKAVAPMMAPKHSTVGAALTEDKPAWTMTQGYPTFLAWRSLGDDQAYYISKLVNETYPSYSTKHKSMKNDWTLDKTLSLFDGDVIPMHPGSVKYFKEIGKWTDAREAANQARIDHQNKLSALWDETLRDAKSKDLDEEALKAAWLEKRAAAGMWTPKN